MDSPKDALSSVASSSTNASQSKPGIIAVAIQVTIIYFTGISQPGSIVIGCVFNLLGLSLMIWTTRLFITVGKGTLVPWNPPEKLVVLGVYRYVRNPLITGVSCVLLGEAVFFGSLWLLGWVGVFVAANMIYIPLGENRGWRDVSATTTGTISRTCQAGFHDGGRGRDCQRTARPGRIDAGGRRLP